MHGIKRGFEGAALLAAVSIAQAAAAAQFSIDTDPESRSAASNAEICVIKSGPTRQCYVLMMMAARISYNRGQYGTSQRTAERAYSILQRLGTADSADGAAMTLIEAKSWRGLYRLDKAETLLVRALALSRKHNGDRSGQTLETITAIAFLRSAQLRYGDAEASFRLSLRLTSELEGPGSSAYAQALTNLSRVLRETGKIDEAVVLSTRALTLFRVLNRDKPVLMAEALKGHASTLLAAERWSEAENLLVEALGVLARANLVLRMHYSLYANLAAAQAGQGRATDAIKSYNAAVLIAARAFPWDKQPEAEVRAGLAQAQLQSAQYAAAEENLREVAKVQASIWQENDPRRATNRAGLAAALLRQCHKLGEARSASALAQRDTTAALKRYTDYDRAAQRDLRRFAPAFRDRVAISWRLMHGCVR